MTQKYTKIEIEEGCAYVKDEFVNDVVNNINSFRPLQLAEFVIAYDDRKLVKSRYFLPDIIEIYLTVISSPFLTKLVRAYSKISKIIKRG